MAHFPGIKPLKTLFRLVSRTVASVADWVILFLVFWLLIIPVALILRAARRDELALRPEKAGSSTGSWKRLTQHDRGPGFFDQPW